MWTRGIATGTAFCNRTAERAQLRRNIDQGSHTVLSATRRAGKSSLVFQTREDLGASGRYVFGNTDFLTVYDGPSVQRAIFKCVSDASRALLTRPASAVRLVKKVFKNLRPSVEIDEDGRGHLRLNLNPEAADTLAEALLGLDQLARSADKRVVLLLDEFQQIGQIAQNASIEGMIRHAMERMKNTSVIISGSNRHLLHQMFDNRGRPLYQLCERLVLERIDSKDLLPFIQHAAHNKWKKPLPTSAVEQILEATQNHVYYLNVLCERLWNRRAPPNAKTVGETWSAYVAEESGRIRAELVELSPNQRGVLQALADGPTDTPAARAFVKRTRIASSSIHQALEVLMERDLVNVSLKGRYRVQDPTIEVYLRERLESRY